ARAAARMPGLTGSPLEGQSVTRVPGLKVRMNATVALARRGSDKVRLDVLSEMLDPAGLREAFVIRSADGEDQPDEAAVLSTVASALKAVVELHRQRPDSPLGAIPAAVE